MRVGVKNCKKSVIILLVASLIRSKHISIIKMQSPRRGKRRKRKAQFSYFLLPKALKHYLHLIEEGEGCLNLPFIGQSGPRTCNTNHIWISKEICGLQPKVNILFVFIDLLKHPATAMESTPFTPRFALAAVLVVAVLWFYYIESFLLSTNKVADLRSTKNDQMSRRHVRPELQLFASGGLHQDIMTPQKGRRKITVQSEGSYPFAM